MLGYFGSGTVLGVRGINLLGLANYLHLILFKKIIILRPFFFLFWQKTQQAACSMEWKLLRSGMKKRWNPNNHICCYATHGRCVWSPGGRISKCAKMLV